MYAQVVIICRRDLEEKKEKKDKTKQCTFQGKLVRTKSSFDLDYEWLKDHFMTREQDFYGKYTSN